MTIFHGLIRPKQRRGNHLESLLATEFMNNARLTATVTSILTILKQGRVPRLLGAFSAYLPPAPLVYPQACMSADGLHAGWLLSLQKYYSFIAFARAVSAESPERQHADFEGVWRHGCILGVSTLIHALEVFEGPDTGMRRQVGNTHQLLLSAAHGHHPCVGEDLSLYIPGWFEQRREFRVALGWPIVLEVAGEFKQAVLKDVSMSGMGLAETGSLAKGIDVIAHLPSGRKMPGEVIWELHGRAGVSLLHPLQADDPLLKPTSSSAQPATEPQISQHPSR